MPSVGFSVNRDALHPSLFDFQRDLVRWALRWGRAAIFAGTGLGKTWMQTEWAMNVHRLTGGDVLMLAPLAVPEVVEKIPEEVEIELAELTEIGSASKRSGSRSSLKGLALDSGICSPHWPSSKGAIRKRMRNTKVTCLG